MNGHTQDYVDQLTSRELEVLRLLAGGLSNREVANELVVSLQTVKWYCKQIYGKLGVNSRGKAVVRASELGLLDENVEISHDLLRESAPRSHNLPTTLTPLIGRGVEAAAVMDILATSRLVTLTGPPGTGKTRLSLKIASEQVGAFENGAWFVDLAPITDPQLVASTIAAAFGISDSAGLDIQETLLRYLGSRELLLILDNFEQVIEAAPLVTELLEGAPRLKVLVTSRELLRVYGEHEYVVPPLSLPDPGSDQNATALSKVDSVALFVQHAKAARHDFDMDGENAHIVCEICVRLDGLPLAIELAAARIRMFSPEQLLARLSDRLSFLTGGARNLPQRQQTIRDAIEWSYDLLGDDEQRFFARLGVFRGGRSLEAAEAVCMEGLAFDVFEGIESLLNKSLLQQTAGFEGEPRFTMLETVHEYALEQLHSIGEAEDIQYRHAEYFTSLAETASPLMEAGKDQIWWLGRMEVEHDNLRAALGWSLGSQYHELGQRLVGALTFFWYRRGYYREWADWVARALDGIVNAPKQVQADVISSDAMYHMLTHHAEAKRKLSKAKQLHFDLGNVSRAAHIQLYEGIKLILDSGEHPEGHELIREAVSQLRAIDHKPLLGQGLNVMGIFENYRGNIEQSEQIFQECLELAVEIGDRLRECVMYESLAECKTTKGDHDQAERLMQKSFGLAQELKLSFMIAANPRLAAQIAAGRQQYERAAVLLGAALAAYDEFGIRIQPGDQHVYDRVLAETRGALGEEKFQELWEQGRRMSLEEGLAFADSGEDM